MCELFYLLQKWDALFGFTTYYNIIPLPSYKTKMRNSY